MSTYYFDTSALIKRYVQEPGTDWIMSLTEQTDEDELFTSHLTGPEIIATFFRKARGGQLLRAEAARIAAQFHADWQQQYRPVEISLAITTQAMQLAEKHLLRGADAIHVSTALELAARRRIFQLPQIVFVSADIEQLNVAQDEGLQTDNPDNYP